MEKLFKILKGTVYPSNVKTIAVKNDPIYGGAHRYFITNTLGFNDGETIYMTEGEEQTIQFVQKHEDETITPGIQNEQLILMLLDRDQKLNERFPHDTYSAKRECLERYLELCKERVEERLQKGVMGKLEK